MRVWDCRSGRAVLLWKEHTGTVLSLDVSPNGFSVASGGSDNTAKVWDLRSKASVYVQPCHLRQEHVLGRQCIPSFLFSAVLVYLVAFLRLLSRNLLSPLARLALFSPGLHSRVLSDSCCVSLSCFLPTLAHSRMCHCCSARLNLVSSWSLKP